MDPCFIHSNESTQKFIWITLKHLQTLFWNRHMVALSQWANAASYQAFHIQLFVQNWNHCVMWYACDLNKLVHFHSSIKTISWTLSMISGVAASIGRPEVHHVDVWPHLNSFTQLCTVAGANALWTLFNSALISFSVKPFICGCLITAQNSFFSILQKIQRLFALIIYRNETSQWIPLKIWQQSTERCYLAKSNVTWVTASALW